MMYMRTLFGYIAKLGEYAILGEIIKQGNKYYEKTK